MLKPVAAPLAILAFWSGMAVAAYAYPAGYDWRYQTISVLLYSDQNPHGYVWAWVGLELCGLAGIAWTAELRRRLDLAIATARKIANTTAIAPPVSAELLTAARPTVRFE